MEKSLDIQISHTEAFVINSSQIKLDALFVISFCSWFSIVWYSICISKSFLLLLLNEVEFMIMKFLFYHSVSITIGGIYEVWCYQTELYYLSLNEIFFIVNNFLIAIANLSAIMKCLVNNKTYKDFNNKSKHLKRNIYESHHAVL